MLDYDAIKSIAPYTTEEVDLALKSLVKSTLFIKGIQFFLPDWGEE